MTRNIVLDEITEAERIYVNGFSKGEFNKFEATLLAKYFIGQGQSEYKAKQHLVEFCKAHDSNFNEVIFKQTISEVIKQAGKYKLKTSKGQIYITRNEVDKLRSMDETHARIVYAMLVLAKHDKFNSPKVKRDAPETIGYFCYKCFEDILKLAKVKIPKEKINRTKYELDGINGYISATLYSIYCYRVNIVDDQSEVVYVVDDTLTMMDYFDLVYGTKNIIQCEICHKVITKKSGKHKMCDECWEKKYKEINRDRMRKQRQKNCASYDLP
jgi:hypothetical protein